MMNATKMNEAYRILGQSEDGEDILPPSFAFAIAAVSLGGLILHGVIRTATKKDWHLINGTTAEFLVVVGFNAIVMGFAQLGYLFYVAYAILGLAILLLCHDVSRAYHITKTEEKRCESVCRAAVARSFPSVVFSDSFRDEYVDRMTGDLNPLESESKYGDFVNVGKRQVLLLALAQFALLAMFVSGLVVRGAPPFEVMQAYVFYWVGILVEACYVAGEDQMQTPYDNYAFFVNALRAARKNKTVVVASDPNTKYELRYEDTNLWARFIVSMAINNSGLLLLMVTLPMQLSWSGDPTEFVLNAVAAFFVIELDDLSTPILYKVIDGDSKTEHDVSVSMPHPSVANTEQKVSIPVSGADAIEEGSKTNLARSDNLRHPSEGLSTLEGKVVAAEKRNSSASC